MKPTYHLFERYGVELEYMIVARDDLRVRPVADELIRQACGEFASDVERGPITWSNELVLHVIELKTTDPATSLAGLAPAFQAEIQAMNGMLAPHGAQLMPTSMHPLMDPNTETRLWPHEYNRSTRPSTAFSIAAGMAGPTCSAASEPAVCRR